MPLVAALRSLLGPDVPSFRLMGEDLVALSGEELLLAAERYREGLEHGVPASLRSRFVEEQRAHALEARSWLVRHNRSLSGRIRGYVALGGAVDWVYPWPVVAILGLVEVRKGLSRMRAWGLVGRAATRARMRGIEEVVDLSEDLLRRTNRGIFADSVPAVLYARRCQALRRAREGALADALLAGPLPPLMDDTCRALAQALDGLLGLPASAERFAALAALTLRHFHREQAIFSHHLGPPDGKKPPAWLARVTAVRTVGAPRIARTGRSARLVFAPFTLPDGFDLRDHEARLDAFGEAYVVSVTRTEDDYAVARDWVLGRFGGAAPG